MESPLAALDALMSPIIIGCNRLRQVHDALLEPMLSLIPPAIRIQINAIFEAVELYERRVGLMKQAGLM